MIQIIDIIIISKIDNNNKNIKIQQFYTPKYTKIQQQQRYNNDKNTTTTENTIVK